MTHYSNGDVVRITAEYQQKFHQTFNVFNALRSYELDELLKAMEAALASGTPITGEMLKYAVHDGALR